MRRNSIKLIGIACSLSITVHAQVEPPFAVGQSRGAIANSEINEASGLVASITNEGCLWTHNDSGDHARVFLIDDSARHRATYHLEGVVARDWEDIGMMEQGGKHYVMVGDIGDNRARYPCITIHVFEEPTVDRHRDVISATIPAAEMQHYVFRYEDGPRDAESIFFDPVDRWLYVITKREMRVGLYGIPWPDAATDTLVLRKQAELPYTFVTAADIRADGSEVLIKNLLTVHYWKRNPGESIPECLSRQGEQLPYKPEPQGEAIAFSRSDDGYYTLSEAALGITPLLYFYPRHQ